jgi:hypothetical protein
MDRQPFPPGFFATSDPATDREFYSADPRLPFTDQNNLPEKRRRRRLRGSSDQLL